MQFQFVYSEVKVPLLFRIKEKNFSSVTIFVSTLRVILKEAQNGQMILKLGMIIRLRFFTVGF